MDTLLLFLSEGPLIDTYELTFFDGLIIGTLISCIIQAVLILLFDKGDKK